MIPALASIIAFYAVARLLQVPIESGPLTDTGAIWARRVALAVISGIAIFLIYTEWKNIQEIASRPNEPPFTSQPRR